MDESTEWWLEERDPLSCPKLPTWFLGPLLQKLIWELSVRSLWKKQEYKIGITLVEG
jgi:hypothetical protein